MTTKITLTYGDAELVVTGEYYPKWKWPDSTLPEFRIGLVEQDGHDVTEHYRAFRLIPMLEEMAREQIEEN